MPNPPVCSWESSPEAKLVILPSANGPYVEMTGRAECLDVGGYFDAHSPTGVSCGIIWTVNSGDFPAGSTVGDDRAILEGYPASGGNYAWYANVISDRRLPDSWTSIEAKVRFTGSHGGEQVTVYTPALSLYAQGPGGE